ncbi:hypothetical protein DPMN_182924 [Dreissena polymorpha]|uniref:Uncharacterized protein n=1 Tax=Dreissena polymorpha TaxID=45954 RepID=A0A9D4I5W7_DREPO|nr:hypothetical protein DPMN_182924 [Dreissena polymorpha]
MCVIKRVACADVYPDSMDNIVTALVGVGVLNVQTQRPALCVQLENMDQFAILIVIQPAAMDRVTYILVCVRNHALSTVMIVWMETSARVVSADIMGQSVKSRVLHIV